MDQTLDLGCLLLCTADLKVLHTENSSVIFANKCTLIVHAVTDVSVESEIMISMTHDWSTANEICFNFVKQK